MAVGAAGLCGGSQPYEDFYSVGRWILDPADGQNFGRHLIDYPYECAEQTLNRFVSTGIVSSLFTQYPQVRKMADQMSKRTTQLQAWDGGDANRKMARHRAARERIRLHSLGCHTEAEEIRDENFNPDYQASSAVKETTDANAR